MTNGWIKIHRKITDWEWWDIPSTRNIFIYLLLKANYKKGTWKGVDINRGQLITSYPKLAQETGTGYQQARSAINNMQRTGEITVRTTNKFSLITIKNYNMFQENNSQITDKQQTKQQANAQSNNNKQEYKEIKKKRNTPLTPQKGESVLELFKKFWDSYPRKIGKKKTLTIWQRMKPHERHSAISSLPAHIKSEQWVKDGGRFIPHPSTWLSHGRWEDVVEQSREHKEYGEMFQNLTQTNKQIMLRRIQNYTRDFAQKPLIKQIEHWIKTEL